MHIDNNYITVSINVKVDKRGHFFSLFSKWIIIFHILPCSREQSGQCSHPKKYQIEANTPSILETTVYFFLSRKKFFAMTFLMSIVWIMVFSYLMVWWTTVIGNFAGILLHDLLTNRHYPLKSKYNQYKADKANKTNPMDKIFILMINVYKASIYHSIFSSKSQLFTNPFNLSFPMMHRENGNLNKKIETLQVAPTHFCHVPGFYLTT